MADFNYGALSSPTDKHRKPSSSFLISPRLLTALASKAFSDTEAVMSPTSILDSKQFYCLKNPFCYETNTAKVLEVESKRPWEKLDLQKIGLGIVDSLSDEKSDSNLPKPHSRMVLFGSQLKIQVPSLSSCANILAESPKSPAEFGTKTRNSHLGSLSPYPANSSEALTKSLSLSEMELSEDYTCIICHGPNPRTTHIFDNYIIASCRGVVGLSDLKKENDMSVDRLSCPSESFLSYCYTCKKNLGQGEDIYIYRGEKAFCSRECRYKEMLMDEEFNLMDSDDVCRTSLDDSSGILY